MALVTNGSPAVQRSKVAASGLERYFKAVVVSGDVGAGKPDPRPFRAALDALGVAATDAVMVGNSLERDIAGAQALGIRAVWVNRDAAAAGNTRPDATVTALSELLGVLARWERPARPA